MNVKVTHVTRKPFAPMKLVVSPVNALMDTEEMGSSAMVGCDSYSRDASLQEIS